MPATLRAVPGADHFATDVVPLDQTRPIPRVAPSVPPVPGVRVRPQTSGRQVFACVVVLALVAFAGPLARAFGLVP